MPKRIGFVFSLCAIGFVSYLGLSSTAEARGHWTELNIGPFHIATDSDVGAARDTLTQLEQLRWVLGGLLESKDLPSLWPIRVLLTNSAKTKPNGSAGQFVWSAGKFVWKDASYILVLPPGAPLPLEEAAGLLIDANTPRLPADVESGLRQLCSTIQAKGSRVTWGGPPAHPDLAWARMQLFATKFEYTLSFHIFLAALKGNTGLSAAERNAFGRDPRILEQEAAASLATGHWTPVSVSGRPLDPKRDFGEHSMDDAAAQVYLADFASDADGAEAAYKTAVEAGGATRALGYEGLARAALLHRENPKPLLDKAISAGSQSAPVFVDAADGLDAPAALPLLKKAAQLNPLWAEPILAQAELATDPAEKQKLLKQATHLAPRETKNWIALAQLEDSLGQITVAQGDWLRAEDSAPSEVERDRVHQLRLDSQQQRLDAAEEARRREREAVHLADEHAQQKESDRIRAAEEKANQTLDQAAGGERPDNVVSWSEVVSKKKLQGSLLRVDCLGADTRLVVKDRTGDSISLVLKRSPGTGLTCGAQQPARRISLTYTPRSDDRLQTTGEVIDLQVH